MTRPDIALASLVGALVADAASLGLHWIYDPARIFAIAAARGGKPAFVPVDAANYEGVPAYFAHGRRHTGMLSQYGETLRLAVRNMIAHEGRLDIAAYQSGFLDHFGSGGTYCGYIDGPTAGTLDNIRNGHLTPSGVDDDQLPAIARLPAVSLTADGPDATVIRAAIEVTNVSQDAHGYGRIAADLLIRSNAGQSLPSALTDAADSADDRIRPLLRAALASGQRDAVAYGETTGRACSLRMGIPLAFHILANSETYGQAIETNILAGGDSCGRGILIGAVMGAQHGIATETGLPVEWLLATDDAAQIWHECKTLAQATTEDRP